MSTVSTIVNEVIVTGRAERQLIDKAAKLWQRISRWTHATDVEFVDGRTAQEKVGNINGITSILNNRDDIAASISSVKVVNDELQYRIGGFRIYRGEDGNIYIVDENAGADSVPKKLGDGDPEVYMDFKVSGTDYLFTEDTTYAYILGGYILHGNGDKDDDGKRYENITLKMQMPNGENINIRFYYDINFKDENSGITVDKITHFGVSYNGSGAMYITCLYLIKNIPAGTLIKKNNSAVLFK